ncbi:DUF4826 family protein [Caulobacter sp. Root1472]|jgi:hypothetical protein|uniref:DUF4826 family protein n=1 Tax=Caulobacter rhizosphaerae TaxID=2010972 RepID=A0ABU1N088_9CAUL|nr:DUF4826 family protein [Caulobacter sp. Root1472]KQZ18202.1 hypothetical protein ASD47_09660 [Caulobacter sp. Root1472]MDR6531712.1 hypothetical protein [Caulobacter rhizosphaerae]
MTDQDEEAWCDARRSEVVEYLDRASLHHGEIGEWPAWHIAPYVSLWAIESVIAPGSVGWWALCGDLPTDYCAANDCRSPREAVAKIARTWLKSVAETAPDDTTLQGLGLDASLGPMLTSRANALLDWERDPAIWAEDR